MFKQKQLLIICCLVISILNALIIPVAKAESYTVDEILAQCGMPTEIIEKMTSLQKQNICEHLKPGAQFMDYDVKEISFHEDGISPAYVELPTSDMTLSVVGVTYNTVYPTAHTEYTVFPSFVWHKQVSIDNDALACAMYPGWEVVPGGQNLRLHSLNNAGESVQQVDINGINPSSSGYEFRIPDNIASMQGLYEGHAYFDVEKVNNNASPRISMQYVHDASTWFNVSYSIAIGAGSISVSPSSSSKLQIQGGNYQISGLS